MREEKIQALSEMKAGQAGLVIAITGDYASRSRLASMGIRVGCDLKLILSRTGGCLVAVHEARVAVGFQAAEHILVATKEVNDVFSQAVGRLKQIWGC